MPIPSIFKDIFWKLPFLSEQEKEKMYYSLKGIMRSEKIAIDQGERSELLEKYVSQILSNPVFQDEAFKSITDVPYQRENDDPKIIAYYPRKCIRLRRTMHGGEKVLLNGIMFLVLFHNL